MNLLDAVHRNEELSQILSQKEQQIEQQDKTSRAQARVIKVTSLLLFRFMVPLYYNILYSFSHRLLVFPSPSVGLLKSLSKFCSLA